MAGVRRIVIGVALALAVLVPAWFILSAMLTKFGLVDWRVGFGLMTFGALKPVVGPLGYAPLAMLAGAVLGLLGLILAIAVKPRRGWLSALVALVVPVAGFSGLVSLQQASAGIPPIHDVSTDLVDPPGFSQAVLDARGKAPGGNALDLQTATIPDSPNFPAFAGKSVLEVHRAAYGDLTPVISDVAPVDVFQIVLDAAKAQGWSVTKIDQASGVIEATQTSFWYGFVDDIAIRVRPLADGTGSVIDVRSVSRVGLSDLGMNAKRVRKFRDDLTVLLNESATG